MPPPSASGDAFSLAPGPVLESDEKRVNLKASDDGLLSSASSSTMMTLGNPMVSTSLHEAPEMPNGLGLPEKKNEADGHGLDNATSSANEHQRSRLTSIMIVATCAVGMVLNVSRWARPAFSLSIAC